MRTSLNDMKKERISITVDSAILEKIRARAEEDDRSLSQYINRLLRKTVQNDEDA